MKRSAYKTYIIYNQIITEIKKEPTALSTMIKKFKLSKTTGHRVIDDLLERNLVIIVGTKGKSFILKWSGKN